MSKIFCIGSNKTGTTSLTHFLISQGLKAGNQNKGELLMDDWNERNFGPIVDLCQNGDFFQDVPFSLPYTYVILDHMFPKSKFIFTVRDNADAWLGSLKRFNLPWTVEHLKADTYVYTGWKWQVHQQMFGVDENTFSNDDIYKDHYNNRNNEIRQYFSHRRNDFLDINLKDQDSSKRICEFLGIAYTGQTMPRVNTTT